jgi:hypothetical protein
VGGRESAAVIAGSSAQALAATVKLSGTYLFTESKFCQPTLPPVYEQAVTAMNLSGNDFTALPDLVLVGAV